MRTWMLIAVVATGCSVIVDNRLDDRPPAPQCRENADCECTKGDCIGGRCTGQPEDDGKSCNLPSGAGSTCLAGGCTCTSDIQCNDRRECTGVERCHRELGVCVFGEPIPEGGSCGGLDAVGVCGSDGECGLR